MSWTVETIQSQVLQLTGYRNISDKVLIWLNRTMQQVAQKDLWVKQTYSTTMGGAAQSVTPSSQWFSVTGLDFINVHHIEYGTKAKLVRHPVQDLYAAYHGLAGNYSVGDFEQYAIPKWGTYTTTTGVQYMAPYFAVFPLTTTATDAFTLHYLSAPARFTATTDTHWILDKYPQMILAGVMRYVMLYVGDRERYLAWKQRFQTGLALMKRQEMSVVASTPNMRGVLPEVVLGGGV